MGRRPQLSCRSLTRTSPADTSPFPPAKQCVGVCKVEHVQARLFLSPCARRAVGRAQWQGTRAGCFVPFAHRENLPQNKICIPSPCLDLQVHETWPGKHRGKLKWWGLCKETAIGKKGIKRQERIWWEMTKVSTAVSREMSSSREIVGTELPRTAQPLAYV